MTWKKFLSLTLSLLIAFPYISASHDYAATYQYGEYSSRYRLEKETLDYYARVTADGGNVVSQADVDSAYKF